MSDWTVQGAGIGHPLTMHEPEEVIMRELAGPAISQASVAITYAFLIAQEGHRADWPKVNAAIQARWSATGLKRVKELAWKYVGQWQRGAKAGDAK